MPSSHDSFVRPSHQAEGDPMRKKILVGVATVMLAGAGYTLVEPITPQQSGTWSYGKA